MTTLRQQITELYRTKKVSNMIVLDQAIMAGVDVDDEAASAAWRSKMVETCRKAIEKAETKAELIDVAQRQVGWLRHIEPASLPGLKAAFEARQAVVS